MNKGRLGLEIQQLARSENRVLVVSDIAGVRNGDRWFVSKDVADLFEALRVPSPKNLRATLANLAARGFVVRRRTGGWSLTPIGHERAVSLVGDLDPAQIAIALADVPGAFFSSGQHSLIPPELAPIQWVRSIRRLLDQYPFERNVFCMTRFPATAEAELPDPIRAVISTTRAALSTHGLTMLLASDRAADDDLFGNVAAHMWASQYGVGLFEDRVGRSLNYNLVIEVGAMVMTGRRCAMLKDVTAPSMPTNLVGRIYKDVDFEQLAGVAAAIHFWAADDLFLGRCPQCPPAQNRTPVQSR
ncbi:MAG TPA: hypothetical protein VK256_02520 [Candidatus Eisenbacteria bacterium]|nr:hypothetical protein [Candidatus Eisenbacteria bacterium]